LVEQIVFEKLSRKELLKIIDMYAKNWLAIDGTWFLAAEQKFGLDTAIELDTESWRRFSPVEAQRIMKEFNISPNSGLEGLKKALLYRVYARLNKQSIEEIDKTRFIYRMEKCRVQDTRKRKGLPDFPCKSVGIVEYTEFAKTIDPRITTRCLGCPPDPHPDEWWCAWEFTLRES
jgi:predicted small secreted protein